MKEEDIKKLSKKELQNIVLKMQNMMSDKQKKEFQKIVEASGIQSGNEKAQIVQARMSDELVNEKMTQIQKWKELIDEGELYLDAEGYEDYSRGYWDSEWITEYYDNQGIGDKIQYMIRFAEDCIDDRRYQMANEIYEWFWEMEVSTASEYEEEDSVDLEILEDWIDLLKEKNGDTEARLLKEAILYYEGIEGLYEMAEKNASVHPSLYLSVMEQYEKGHLYEKKKKLVKMH